MILTLVYITGIGVCVKDGLSMHDVHELGIKGSECHGSGQDTRIR